MADKQVLPQSGNHGQDTITSTIDRKHGQMFEGGASSEPLSATGGGNERIGDGPSFLSGSGAGQAWPAGGGRVGSGNGGGSGIGGSGSGSGSSGGSSGGDSGSYYKEEEKLLHDAESAGSKGERYGMKAGESQGGKGGGGSAPPAPAPPSGAGSVALIVGLLVAIGVGAWYYFKKHHKTAGDRHDLS